MVFLGDRLWILLESMFQQQKSSIFDIIHTYYIILLYIYIYCVDTSTCPGPLGQTFHLLTAAVENTKLIELAAAFGGAVAGLVQPP